MSKRDMISFALDVVHRIPHAQMIRPLSACVIHHRNIMVYSESVTCGGPECPRFAGAEHITLTDK